MTDVIVTMLLWVLAIGAVVFCMNSDTRHPRWPEALGGPQAVIGILAAALFMLLLLTGCSTPAVKDRIVEVKVPVAIQPIKPEDVPPLPSPLGPRPPTLRQTADRAFAGFCEAIAYVLKADPLLRISAGQLPRDLPAYPECEGR